MKEEKEVIGRLVRTELQEYIEVFIPGVGTKHLYEGIVEHCARDLSPNEIRKVWADCEAQIKTLGIENTPEVFHQMMNDLRQAMINRRIIESPPEKRIIIEKNKEITWRSGEKGIVRVTFELPIPSLSEEEKKMLPESFEELTKKAYEPIVNALAAYLAGLQLSGFEGPTEGIPIFQKHIAEASREMIDVLKFRKWVEKNYK